MTSDDQARRNRVKRAMTLEAIRVGPTYIGSPLVEAMADAAIAAMNEPELPQLLVDMAKEIRLTPDTNEDHRIAEAWAALGVVIRQLFSAWPAGLTSDLAIVGIARNLGIPESMVKELLDADQ